MRVLGIAISFVIIVFWLLMNSLLVQRVIEYRGLDEYRRGVIDYLGDQVRRERQMGIYHNRKRIGYTRFAIERMYEHDRMSYLIEYSTQIDIDILGKGGKLALDGEASLDSKMVPNSLNAEIKIGAIQFQLEGLREEKRFLLKVRSANKVVFQHGFPLQELILSDGLAPILPVAGLHTGETYKVTVFDPIFHQSELVEMKVLGTDERFVDGIVVDCYEVETRYRGTAIHSYITSDGEVLSQEFPSLSVKLIREPIRKKGKKQ